MQCIRVQLMTSAAVFEPASMKFQCIKIVRLHDIVLTKGIVFLPHLNI